MKHYFLFGILLFLIGCKNEIHVSGIVVDEITMEPIDNVLVRTIKDAKGIKLEFFETRTKDGKFSIDFLSQSLSSNEISVELSKDGYLTNVYSCFQDRPNDTLVMRRNNY